MSSGKITIIDYGIGNTHSVSNALTFLGYKVKVSDKPAVIKDADLLVLPGVGAFEEAIRNLHARHLTESLSEEVLIKKKPLLGICLGMQLLATWSEENGKHTGLNFIPGQVKKLELPESYSVPHVGWNDIQFRDHHQLFSRIENNCHFYFDHSYHFECDSAWIAATCQYGITVTAAVRKDNIFGVQFHPEKSQTSGLKLFRGLISSL